MSMHDIVLVTVDMDPGVSTTLRYLRLIKLMSYDSNFVHVQISAGANLEICTCTKLHYDTLCLALCKPLPLLKN